MATICCSRVSKAVTPKPHGAVMMSATLIRSQIGSALLQQRMALPPPPSPLSPVLSLFILSGDNGALLLYQGHCEYKGDLVGK